MENIFTPYEIAPNDIIELVFDDAERSRIRHARYAEMWLDLYKDENCCILRDAFAGSDFGSPIFSVKLVERELVKNEPITFKEFFESLEQSTRSWEDMER